MVVIGSMPMGANRREHTRFALNLSAEVKTEVRTFEAQTQNLSEGGCCIESAYPMVEGDMVRVSLFLIVDGIEDESMPPMVCGARVQWTVDADADDPTSRHMAGLKFDAATDQQKAWLANFLAKTGASE